MTQRRALPALAAAFLASIGTGRAAQAERAQTYTGKAGIEWVLIPGGNFMMGAVTADWKNKSKVADQMPVHPVKVPSFWMAKTMVTNRQYQACVDAGACAPAYVGCAWTDPGMNWGCPTCTASQLNAEEQRQLREVTEERERRREGIQTEPDRPVVCVDWAQANMFSEWAAGRLPSEAEWEYAARGAGKNQTYPWGNAKRFSGGTGSTVEYRGAKLGRNDGFVAKSYFFGATSPVCRKPTENTAQGLCDLTHNAGQWVRDWYHPSYKGAPGVAAAWESPAGAQRVIRGVAPESSSRAGLRPEVRSDYIGFRPVQSAVPPAAAPTRMVQ